MIAHSKQAADLQSLERIVVSGAAQEWYGVLKVYHFYHSCESLLPIPARDSGEPLQEQVTMMRVR